VVLGRERLAVAAVQDRWRIDDEWWRERPVRRVYFDLFLQDGRILTVCKNILNGKWFRQHA